jgi:anaphase-promoting complex subunit 6
MSSLSASAASILLHAFVLTTLLLAATVSITTAFVPVVDHRDDVNTTMFTNGSLTSTPSAENWEMYYCFLCTGRHPLLIHYCPIYLDECHLNCWDAIPEASSAGRRRPTPRRCRARSATS